LTRLEKSIEIMESPEKIWPYLCGEGITEWYPNIRSHEFTSEKRGLGAIYHVAGEGDDQKFEYNAIVTEYVENERVGWRTTSGDWTAFGSITLKPIVAGTVVMYMIDYALPYSLLGMIIDRLRVSKSMREGLETALKNLKKLVEEEK
jgi:uncharacterized membrane protein